MTKAVSNRDMYTPTPVVAVDDQEKEVCDLLWRLERERERISTSI